MCGERRRRCWLLALSLLIISHACSNPCFPCRCYPPPINKDNNKAHLMLCQGYRVTYFPPLPRWLASELREIYVTDTSIACMPNTTGHLYSSLRKFGESGNGFWNCDCMWMWMEGISDVVVSTHCARVSTTTSPRTTSASSSDVASDVTSDVTSDATETSSPSVEWRETTEVIGQTSPQSDQPAVESSSVFDDENKKGGSPHIALMVAAGAATGVLVLAAAVAAAAFAPCGGAGANSRCRVRWCRHKPRGLCGRGCWCRTRRRTDILELEDIAETYFEDNLETEV